MVGPTVNVTSVPTGGAVMLSLPDYATGSPPGVTDMTISIATSGVTGLSSFVTVYSGAVLPVYLDVGDAFAQPLQPGQVYVYQVADARGSTQSDPVTTGWTIQTQSDQLSQILIRLIQGAVNSIPLPAGIQRTVVSTQMPQNGLQALPFIVVNLDLTQQTRVQIGEDFPNPDQSNIWTMFAHATRHWRVTVLSTDAEERDFYRDNLLAAFQVMMAYAFQPLGLNVTHSFQAASYTDVKEWDGLAPGFYGADLMFELDGVFPLVVLTGYGPMEHILSIATGMFGSVTPAETPNLAGSDFFGSTPGA